MQGTTRRKGSEENAEGSPQWLVTYGDLMTQLVVFFVMLFAFSTIDPEKAGAVSESFRGTMSGGAAPSAYKYVLTTLWHGGLAWWANDENDFPCPGKDELGRKFLLSGDLAFDEGSAELRDTKETRNAVHAIVRRMRGGGNILELRGYTSASDADSIPGRDGKPDHWTLGFQRAKAVADRLIESGCDYRRLRITSGGMTAPYEKNENLERRHLNRRVEVLETDALMPD